jgi:HTH-type transcriptional regulator/antitoxin HigA
MTVVSPVIDLRSLQRAWVAFDELAHLRPIRTKRDYDRTIHLMNGLLDVVGDTEDHPLSGLLDLVGEIVAEYGSRQYAIPRGSPRDVLRFLMEQRGLRQADLGAVVPQSNLSAILSGKREVSATLAGKLSDYFEVGAEVFIRIPERTKSKRRVNP